jgi:transcriptional antiterminator RfaH
MRSFVAGPVQQPDLGWFCVRSQRRNEHIAAANLQKQGIPVVNPRIRFRRPTVRGPVWVTESMFPTYLFARFDWERALSAVQHTFGVSGVVHFGFFWPVVPDEIIEELQLIIGPEGIRLVEPAVRVGDAVEVATGAFEGFRGIVTRVMPAKDRVAVLLQFLGRETNVELPMTGILKDRVEQYAKAV